MAYIQDVQESVPALPEAGNLTSFVVLSQNENGRKLLFKIVGIDIPSGSTATFSGTKPDGVVYSTTGTISGNIVTVNEDIQMTAVAGSWDAKIRVLNGGNVIASAKVRMTIDADPVDPGAIPSDSQLDGIVAECQAYAESARSDAYGSPLTASTAAGMIDKTRVYVYTGSETGYTNGHWYYWDGTAWADGGTYNSSGIQTDTTLSVPGMAADAKAAGDEISDLKEDISDIDNLLFNGSSSEAVEINQLTDSISNSLALTYKWVIGIVPSNATTEPIKIVVQGNSTAIVKLEKWEWNGTGYALSETVTADSVEPYTQASGQHYILTFSGFTANAKTLLSFSDSSSAGWVRYRSNATGYTAKRFPKNLTSVTEADFLESPNTEILYYLKYTTYAHKIAKYTNIVIVDATGKGDYTTVVDAVATEPEGTVFRIMPGVYEGTVQAFQKRIILIGTDRNQCILKSTDGRYDYPAINGSCGYIENLTLASEYVSGESNEIDSNTSGAYAFHCEDAYGIGKTLEFHHCTLISDFFPALGAGLRKDFHLILDDCELRNNQIVGRGAYSNLTEGSLGALYFHDANGEQGDQYITVKNSILKSTLGTSMTPYQVTRETQNNKVFCDFIGNVLYDARHGYANNIWYRGDPFNADTGIFSIVIGYGNSNNDLNNN